MFVFKCVRRTNCILKISNPRVTPGRQKPQSITARDRKRESVNDSTNNPRVWFLTQADQSIRLPIGWPAGMQLTSDPSHTLADTATRHVCEHACHTQDPEHGIKHFVPFVCLQTITQKRQHRSDVCLSVWLIQTHIRCLLRAMACRNKPQKLYFLSLFLSFLSGHVISLASVCFSTDECSQWFWEH